MKSLNNEIAGCIVGDRNHQFAFFKKYSPWGYTICRRYTNDEFQAQEMLQDGFLRIFKKLHQFDTDKGEIKSWMRKVIVSCALNYLKKKSSDFKYVEIDEVKNYNYDTSDHDKFDKEEIIFLLSKMPLGYRAVFNLNVIDGYSHKEIAGQLGISENTSRTQLMKAKKWIAKRFENQSNFIS